MLVGVVGLLRLHYTCTYRKIGNTLYSTNLWLAQYSASREGYNPHRLIMCVSDLVCRL